MKRVAISTALMFVFALYAAAGQSGQTGYPGSGSTDHHTTSQSGANAQGKPVIGCLQQSGDQWTVQTTDMGQVQLDVPQNREAEFRKHIGHSVRVIGEWENGGRDTAAERGRSDLPQSDQAAAGRKFKAERVDMVSQSCPEPGSPGSQQPGTIQPGTQPQTQPQP